MSTTPLTAGVDNIVGTSANNIFDASRVITGGQSYDALGSADSIDGGAGTDTLFVQATSSAAAFSVTPASLKNIEVLQIENIGTQAYTVSLANGDALLKTIKVSNSATAAGTVTVSNNNVALTTLELSNVATAVSVASIATAVVGTTDALAINLSSATGAQGVSIAGYETVTLTSNGTVANSIGTLTDSSLATLNIAGAQDVTLVLAATSLGLSTINAATATGKVNVTLNAAQTQAVAITGGTVNDTISMGGTYTSADVINGGTGTDTLTLTSAEAVAATVVQSNVTSIETIAIAGATGAGVAYNLTNFAATTLTLDGTAMGAGTLGITYSSGTNALTLSTSASGGAVTATTSGVATTDVLNVSIGNATAGTGNTFGANAFVSTGAETVNISSVGAANSFGAAVTLTNTAATETLNVTGNQTLTITGAVTADAINASGMTGTGALVMTAGTVTVAAAGVSITGSANGDTLIGSVVSDIIAGGAGNDRITGGLLSDTLTGGAGADTFVTLTGAAASVYVGSLATTADMDRITDFVAGTDKIALINGTTPITSVAVTAVTVGTAADVAALLTAIGTSVAASAGAASKVGVITVTAGAMAGTYLLVNDETNAAAATDTLINITGVSGTVSASDFVYA